jgi:hypothetical protein
MVHIWSARALLVIASLDISPPGLTRQAVWRTCQSDAGYKAPPAPFSRALRLGTGHSIPERMYARVLGQLDFELSLPGASAGRKRSVEGKVVSVAVEAGARKHCPH